MSEDYEVGYCRPPKETRFKAGESGNPKGRPATVHNFKTDVKKTLTTSIRLTQDGKPRTVSTQQALLMRLREKALKGDPRAMDRLMALAQTYNAQEMAVVSGEGLSASDQEILDNYRQRLVRQEQADAAHESTGRGDS